MIAPDPRSDSFRCEYEQTYLELNSLWINTILQRLYDVATTSSDEPGTICLPENLLMACDPITFSPVLQGMTSQLLFRSKKLLKIFKIPGTIRFVMGESRTEELTEI